MNNFTTNTYQMKREISNFSKKICESSSKPETKFVTDMLYGISKLDGTDIIKPLGKKFEDLGMVRDGSSRDKSYEKGYHHTEIVGLTKDMKQPISIFSKIHSSIQKDFISSNKVTYEGLDKVIKLLNKRGEKGIFVHDRGYDNNDIFNYYFTIL